MAKLTCNFISYTLMRSIDMTVIIPSITIPESIAINGGLFGVKGADFTGIKPPDYRKYTDRPKYPGLYLFHGMGNNHATWTGYTNIELFAEERNIAVVMISSENKGYVNSDSGDRFYDFIENELMDFVCGMFPISACPEDTYIAGLSMGGYGTLVHAFNNPWKFAAIGAFSAAIDINPSLETWFSSDTKKDNKIDLRYSPRSLAEKAYNNGIKLPKIYIACGEEDKNTFEINFEYKQQLVNMGYEVTWDQIPGYAHEWRFWNIEIERFLDWLPRTDIYADKDKRQV